MIKAWRARPGGRREWRTHFHVWWERAEVVEEDRLEIETDTWDVLPARLTTGEVIDYGGREPD